MWIATQHYESISAVVRRDGKFTPNDASAIAAALIEWPWANVMSALANQCRNMAATALLDGQHRIAAAKAWIARAEAIEALKEVR